MSKFEGPISGGDVGTSTKRRLPIVFCLDVSGSMIAPMGNGETRISELNRAFTNFIDAMKEDPVVAQSADIAVITFGGKVAVKDSFAPLLKQEFTKIEVNERSFTPMGSAVSTAMQLVGMRKEIYKKNGIKFFKPWVVVITDGEPEGPDAYAEYENALIEINEAERNGDVVVFNVAVGDDCNFDQLKRLSVKNKEPYYVKNASDLGELMKYLVVSSKSVTSGKDIEEPKLKKGKKISFETF